MVGARIKILWEEQLVDPPNKYKYKTPANKCVIMTEIYTIDGYQKDALLKRANIKKIHTALH